MRAIAKQIAAILLISGVVAVVANVVHPRGIPFVQSWSDHVEARARKEGIEVIPLSVALTLHADNRALFVDARPLEDFDAGRVRGALSAPASTVHDAPEALFNLIGLDRPLVIYCRDRDCDDGLLLAAELLKMGSTNHVLYIDGFELWKKHGGPVEP